MKIIQDLASFLFVGAVGILTMICVLGVWDVFDHDVIIKSFETVGLLAAVAVVVIVAGKYLGNDVSQTPSIPNPAFITIRRATLLVLIVAASLLALLGVLSIWDFISDKDVLYKSVGSLATLAFGAFVIVATCMERENNPLLKKQGVSVGGAIAGIILLYLVFAFGGLFY